MVFEFDQESGKYANGLEGDESRDTKILDSVLTVWLGGTLECPPGDLTSTRRSKYPFSVTPGVANRVPYFS